MARVIRLALFAALIALWSGIGAAAVEYHVCLRRNGVLYDIHASDVGTTFDRWNLPLLGSPVFVDRNTFAVLHPPAAPGPFPDAVVFAAAMQTHQVWPNTEPNTGADFNSASMWTFHTTIANVPTDLVFQTSDCMLLPTPDPVDEYQVCHISFVNGQLRYFSIHTGPAGTVMDRWNIFPALGYAGRELFPTLHPPVPQNAMWGEGVQFAATMQTRNAWVNTQPNTEAYWSTNPVDNSAQWRFLSSVPAVMDFTRGQCLPFLFVPPASPLPPPVTQASYRLCLFRNGIFYDLRTSAAGTTFDRYNLATPFPWALIDHNTFATLHPPASPADNWGEGVQFAATMQTRGVWVNTQPNTEAHWIQVLFDDRWRFHTVINNVPTIIEFRESYCPPGFPPLP